MKTLLLTLALTAAGDWTDAMLSICGAACLEELDQETVEHFEKLHSDPINLNTAPRSRLLSSRLLNSYKTVSLEDYLSETGDIRSFSELSLVDGFTAESVEKIRPFIKLEPSGLSRERYLAQDITFRAALNGISGQYYADCGSKLEASAATSGAFSLSYRNGPLYICAGDYHARFAQGLTLWSSMTTSGAGNATLSRNPGGIKGCNSLSRGTRMRGVAATYFARRTDITAFWAAEGMAGMNGSYRWKSGQAGMTAVFSGKNKVVGIDTKFNVKGLDVFGELSCDISDRAGAGLIGASWSPRYRERVSALARLYSPEYNAPRAASFRSSSKSSDEAGLTLAGEFRDFVATVDASERISDKRRHLKILLNWKPEIKAGEFSVKPSMRITERIRPDEKLIYKTDLRADLSVSRGNLILSGRFNTILYRGCSWLWYAEGGYEGGNFSAFLRGGIFKADNWDDRIYVWQRDVPGTFNVPAFYGRGWNVSAFIKLKKALSLRASIIRYPLDPDRNSCEVRLQYVKHFFHPYPSGAFHKHDRITKRIG